MSKVEKKSLFDNDSSGEDDGEKCDLKINKDYAQRYDEWREAEIKRKLEDKYGNLDEDLSSSSSDDDDDSEELEKAVSKDFFEVISQLRKKDPKIYNPEVRFFNDEENPLPKQDKKKKKDKPVYLRDYERNLILERGGKLSDEDSDAEDERRAASPSLADKEKALKESLKKFVHSDSDDDNDDDILVRKVKTDAEKKKEEEDYIEWLRGRKQELEDKSLEESLSTLKQEWNNPNLEEGEKFLRDYVLNKRYLDPEEDEVDTGNLTDEEFQEEYMDDFERKYNFRFEEPDGAFLKRYPRTIESSVRKTDDRRKRHREEVKKRKEEEKLRQREELKVLKSLKKKEILKKIEKLKEITGNAELGITDIDLEGDYDPEKHDRKMKQLFNDDFYQEGDDEVQLEDLPLPPLEEELLDDYENWDEYEGDKEEGDEELHCEDPNFIMDCDYDPATSRLEKEARPKSSRERRKLKRQSRFGTLVRKKKPTFNPSEKSFQQYVDEYYGVDYEDIVGGVPCRFKYRNVTPNNFGLTIEEILAADDKELNAWVSIKKATAFRPEHVELNEKKIYELKARNEELKRKILPSLYRHENEESEEKPWKRKKKIRSEDASDAYNYSGEVDRGGEPEETAETGGPFEEQYNEAEKSKVVKSKKKVKQEKLEQKKTRLVGDESQPSSSTVFDSNKKSSSKKFENKTILVQEESHNASDGQTDNLARPKKLKKKSKGNLTSTAGESSKPSDKLNNTGENSKKGKKRKLEEDVDSPQLSKKSKVKDARQSGTFLKDFKQSKSFDKKRKVGQQKTNTPVQTSAESNRQEKRKRSGKQRKKLKHLEKFANDVPRDIKSENKARAIKKSQKNADSALGGMSDSRLRAYGLNPKKFKNKLMYA